MTQTLTWYQTTLGKKVVVAVTGVILVGYLVAHMLGNLQIFIGREAINAYSAFLHSLPEVLWGARVVLLASIVAHIVASVQLATRNQDARALGYRQKRYRESSYYARTMLWSGPLIATFVVYHLLHLTTGTVGPRFAEGDVYSNLVRGFSVPYIAGFYVVAMVLLGMHLRHGLWSLLQTLGLSHPRWNETRGKLATGLTVVLVLGFISVPVAVLTGLVG
jgi:succinate dehydrogenase / fumarate reductase cytochrome b subunit